jgi:hypothetical protein
VVKQRASDPDKKSAASYKLFHWTKFKKHEDFLVYLQTGRQQWRTCHKAETKALKQQGAH